MNRLKDIVLKRIGCTALATFCVGAFAAQSAEEFRVPLMNAAPKLDGRIEPGE